MRAFCTQSKRGPSTAIALMQETVTMLHYDAPQTEIVFRPGHRHAEFIKDIELQKQVR